MKYDISVIIPIYNSEAYLTRALGNVLNQTKKNIQIILINDASTDGSLRIMNDAKVQKKLHRSKKSYIDIHILRDRYRVKKISKNILKRS